ncbi:endoplasmic reticulum-Golgi intermediate compartment protein 2-like isoform X2 [Stegodyphus dumicola]|uniref:endoplasmic reticulum-Golgi intermediate compartment protein 2-like isoform X2 n=1 Tax=Stegodyphus dumicola TaxID=202533 RepID=UPI0015AD2710|nr:endoplasmic reticulum-Golgi intermediate compartment protein 2-like isoform X2 [Stegodyphus dumicola]
MLRRNIQKLKHVENFDIFPKVHEEYKQPTASGGTVSILSFIMIIVLVYTEIRYYSSSQLKFEYSVDHDIDSKLKINVDITVAMPCATIGADILDVTNQNTEFFGELDEELTHFEMTEMQKAQWQTMQRINLYIREEYHAIQDLIWRDGYTNILRGLPTGSNVHNGPPNACRLKGSLVVNKVSGNFHITAGKHIPLAAGHAHISAFLKDSDYNFSHRIERFSFGEPSAGIFDPLEGDEKTAPTNFHMYQYYLKVVPTEIVMNGRKQNAYQYSVTEQARAISHQAGSHGVPGIYFKYDMSFIKVKVTVEKHSIWRILVRLCGIIGGVFATSGILNGLVKLAVDFLNRKKKKKTAFSMTSPSLPTVQIIAPEKPPKINQTLYL